MAWWNLPGLAPFIDLVCPPRCAFCGADLPVTAAGGPMACASCAAAISIDSVRCGSCGEPVSSAECRCRGRCSDWDGIVVLASYGDGVRGQVLRANRHAGESVAAALAGLLVAKHRETFTVWRIDAVVPEYQVRIPRSELSPLALADMRQAQVVVVVGASETGLSLLESLLLSDMCFDL